MTYRFGAFEVDCASRELRKGGIPLKLGAQPFTILTVLLERAGEEVLREEIQRRIWSDGTQVDFDKSINSAVNKLRDALADSADRPRYIETIPRKGYRFIGPLEIAHNPHEADSFMSTFTVPTPPDSSPENILPKPRTRYRTWAMLVAVVLIGMGLTWWWTKLATAQPIESIVVLPFVNLSGDASREYFSDGLTDEVINALAPVPGLRVVARTSAFQFKNQGADVRTIGQKLNVDAVLEGSVRISGDQLRVTAQLIDARNGFHHWSRTWDHSMKDPFAAQRHVAGEVLRTLGRDDTAPAAKPLTRNLTAYDHYLRGAFLAERVDNGKLAEAIAEFKLALKEDSSFAAAYAFAARAYLRSAVVGAMAASRAVLLARQNVQKALELEPKLAAAHAVQGAISFYHDWDWDAAERAFRLAISYNPTDGNSHHEYAHYLLAMGRFEEAFSQSQKQIVISPVDVEALAHVAFHHLITGDLPRAIESAQRALAVDPRHKTPLRYLQYAYERTGRFEDAIGVVSRRAIGTPSLLAALRKGWRANGATGYWTVFYEVTRQAQMPEDVRARRMAGLCARLGRKDEMIDWLESASAFVTRTW